MQRKKSLRLTFRVFAIISLAIVGVLPVNSGVKANSPDPSSWLNPGASADVFKVHLAPTPKPSIEGETRSEQDTGLVEKTCDSPTPGKTERCLGNLLPSRTSPKTIRISGNPIRISVAENLRVGVSYNDVPQFFGGDHSGVYLWINGLVFGSQPWGKAHDYTPVSQQFSGDGSAASPWKATTVVDAANLLRITQEITSINGQSQVGYTWVIQNLTSSPLSYSLFHAADFMTAGDDYKVGFYNPTSGTVGGWDYLKSRFQILLPGTLNSSYFAGPYEEVWDRIGYASPGEGFNNTIRMETIDHGAGFQWNNMLPGESKQTIKDTLVYGSQSPTNYHISGRVLNTIGMPLGGVSVTANGGYLAVTDVYGYYTLTDLPAGRYRLAAALKDYTFTSDTPTPVEVPRDQIMINFLAAAAGSKTLDMKASASPKGANQSTVYIVSGKITDVRGFNLSGVIVTIDATHAAVTNASGYYEIGGLGAGNYTITPAMSGYAFTPSTLSVTIPGQTTNLNFSANPTTTYQVSGKVTRPGGTVGLIGVKVYADDHHMGLTDGQGNYAISGIYPGTYTIRAVWDGYQFSSMTVMPLDLTADAVVDFIGEPNPNWISGKVTVKDSGVPLPGVTVTAGCGYTTVTDAAGQYTISGLADRIYFISASMKGYTFTDSPIEASVPPGQENVDFIATPQENLIQGSLTMNATTPQPLAGVEITSGGYVAITDINGHFSMAGLAAGNHTLGVDLEGFTLNPAEIIVPVPSQEEIVILAAHQQYTVAGIITSITGGTPMPAVSVSLDAERKTATNVNGYYIFAGLPAATATYEISGGLTGYDVSLSGSTSPLSVPPAQTAHFLATPTSKVGKIEGLLLNTNPNEYLTGVLVSAKPNSIERCSAGEVTFFGISDVNGFYQVGGLVGGDYTLDVVKNGYTFIPQTPYLTYAPRSGLIFNGEEKSDSFWIDGHLLAVGSGLAGVYMYLREGAGNSTYVNANGYYRIAGLPAGGYTVVPSLNFYTFDTNTIMPVRVGDVPGEAGKTVDFEAANSSSATPMYFVSGRIMTPKDIPLAFVPLTLSPGGLNTVTDRSGSYTLGWLTAGTYTISPSNPDSETNCQFVVKKSGASTTPPLQVVLPQTGPLESVTDGDFEATCTMNVNGKIVDEAGVGVAGVTFVAKHAVSGSTISATSAADGRFVLPSLGEGIYAVLPISSGFRYTPQSFQINPPVSVSLPEFTAQKLPVMYRVSGMIRDGFGRPMTGVTIRDNAGDLTISDSSGNYELSFSISNLPTGVDMLEILATQGSIFFTPATRSISVTSLIGKPPNPTTPDITGIDFTSVMQ